GALLVGLEVDHGVAVLAAAAGLAHELPMDVRYGVAHGLAIGDLWAADVGVDLELAQKTVHDDLEVELAHAADDGLAGLLVRPHAEGRILLGQALERRGELVLVGLGLGLDRLVDDGLGKVDRLEDDRTVRIAERV